MNTGKEFLGFNRRMLLHIAILYAGIWAGLIISPYVFVAIAGFTAITAVFKGTEFTFYHLFFLLPFTTILKFSPKSTSIFAYLMIATAAILILKQKRIQKVPIILIMLFFAYAALGMGDNYTTVFKMVAGLLLLYVFVAKTRPGEFKNHIMAYSLGMLGSSVIGTLKESWSRLTPYFVDLHQVYLDEETATRFTGLNYDPNYYSVGVIIAIFLMIRLLFNKDGNKFFLISLITTLVVFGFISYSKMFLLVILLLGIICAFHRMKTGKQLLFTLISAAVIIFVFYKWANSSGYISVMNQRLFGGDISTGRLSIWKDYIDYIWNSPKTLFFGEGLGASYYKSVGPHNAYIELVYFFGVFCSWFFVAPIAYIMKKSSVLKRRKFFDIALLILFFTTISFLGMVTVNELMFYFMLVWVSMNMGKDGTS
jgi:hypothetical protein